MKKVFDIIDALTNDYIAVWEDVCKIDSPTNYKAGVDAVGDYFINMAKARGFEVEVLTQSVSGNAVCITMNADVKAKPFVLSGHMDTVFPMGTFGVSRDSEKIYGPGVCDCKGGIVSAFLTMDALHKCGFNNRPVMLLLQSDEENGSAFSNKETINYICKKAKDAVCFLNMEGANAGLACLGRKGIANYTVTVNGIAGHSAKCATEGANAVLEAAHKIIAFERFKDADGITCNCGVINGGTVFNALAESCTFTADFRYKKSAELKTITEFVENITKTAKVNGCTSTYVMSGNRPPMEEKEQNFKLLDRLNEIWQGAGLSQLLPSFRNGGSDAAEVTEAGIPCVDNIGVLGGGIHSVNEYAYISSLNESAKRVVSAILNI